MTLINTIFNQAPLYTFNQSTSASDILSPFAYTDVLTNEASDSQQSFLHFWENDKTVILGMKDTRLPYLADGLNILNAYGYRYLARNSGGLAVVSDAGILNVSLIIPVPENQTISITEAYDIMWQVIKDSFSDFPVIIEAKEISDSYCPGEYDLSINGRKFAGIAQRRIRQGIAVMIYLSVNGPQAQRGEMIRKFYQKGLKEQFGQNGYPPVRVDSMANLSDLLETPLTINDVKDRIMEVFRSTCHSQLQLATLESFILKKGLTAKLEKNIEKMLRRNADIIQIGVDTP